MIGPEVAADRSIATYARGSTIHVGDQTVDVGGRTIHAYVRTDDGFVFSDAEDDVYFADGDSVEQIGAGVVREGNLRADHRGSYVAWVNSDAEVPEFVVYDTGSRSEVLRTTEGNHENQESGHEAAPASIIAVDGPAIYVINGSGLGRTDIKSGELEQIHDGDVNEFEVMDVVDQRILHVRPGTHFEQMKKRIIGSDYSTEGARVPAYTDDLSPDGRYAAGTTNIYARTTALRLTDLRSGESRRLSTPNYKWVSRTVWLDADTVLAEGIRAGKAGKTDLLSCEISSEECTTAARDIGPFGKFQLPDGQFESDEGL